MLVGADVCVRMIFVGDIKACYINIGTFIVILLQAFRLSDMFYKII